MYFEKNVMENVKETRHKSCFWVNYDFVKAQKKAKKKLERNIRNENILNTIETSENETSKDDPNEYKISPILSLFLSPHIAESLFLSILEILSS